MVPRAVLMKSGLVSINTARQVNVAHTKTTVNAARPMSYLSKKAHSTVKRPIHKNTTFKNSNFNQRVNTVKDKNVNTLRQKIVVNVVKGNNFNVVKASACWVWKPKTKVFRPYFKTQQCINHPKEGNLQMDLQDRGKEPKKVIHAFEGSKLDRGYAEESFLTTQVTRSLDFSGCAIWKKGFQVYVDDIIFGSTKKELCNAFEKLMHEKFQMSSKGELIFFLGLQLEQKKDGIFISQDKYVGEILKKFRSMIGSLMYLISSRPNIMFTMCSSARYQVNPKATVKAKTVNGEVQLQALMDGKKIIITESTMRRDLQLEDAEGVDCLPNATIFEQLTLIGSKTTTWNKFSSTMASAIICLAINQKFNFSKYIFESMVKNLDNVGKFLMYPSVPSDNVADEAINEEMDDSLERAATTATSLDAKQDRGNINKTQSLGTSSGGGPRCQETMGDTSARTRFERVSKTSNDPLLAGVNTPRSGEDSLKLTELMEFNLNGFKDFELIIYFYK
ncbi:retrovirus-related pol polyprotein from transposon TNT 1-94 [Tanacetum coccineum]